MAQNFHKIVTRPKKPPEQWSGLDVSSHANLFTLTPIIAHHVLAEVASYREVGAHARDDDGALQVHPKNNSPCPVLGLCSSIYCLLSDKMGETTEGQTSWQGRETIILTLTH